MAKGHGRLAYFELDTQGGTLKDLTAFVEDVSGLPGDVDLTDITTFGSTGHKYYPGLQKASFSVKMVMDDATDGSWDVCKDFQTDTSTRSFVLGPRGHTSGYPKIYGECRIKTITIPVKPTEPNIMDVSFEMDDGITIGTFSA